MIVASGLGLLGALGYLVVVFTLPTPEPNLKQPYLHEIIRSTQGLTHANPERRLVRRSAFGSIQKLRSRTWGLSLTAAIITLINPTCCIVGLPIGIWALVVLMNKDV